MEYEAFFFDFDGVLADSVEVKTEAFAKMFEPYGRNVAAEVVSFHIQNGGMARADKFRYYYKTLLNQPINDDLVSHLSKQFADIVVKKVIQCDEIPGARLFLAKWSQEVPCYVVSAAPDEEISIIVRERNISHFFRGTYGVSKPKHKHLERILKKNGYIPENCLFFGDSISDYSAASKQNVPFIGITKTANSPLKSLCPNITCSNDFLNLSISKYK